MDEKNVVDRTALVEALRRRDALYRAALVRIQELSDDILSGPTANEPYDILLDMGEIRENKLVYDGFAAYALQIVKRPSNENKMKIKINRTDGPFLDPYLEELYVAFPIVRIYVTNVSDSGTVHLRILRDPLFLLSVTPKLRT